MATCKSHTMASADFSQFVVTTANGTACETSPVKVRTLSLHVPAAFTRSSSNFWTSVPFATLSVFPSLICGSCPSGQRFGAASFRFRLTADTLAVRLCASLLPTRTWDFHPLENAHAGQTKAEQLKSAPLRYDNLWIFCNLIKLTLSIATAPQLIVLCRFCMPI